MLYRDTSKNLTEVLTPLESLADVQVVAAAIQAVLHFYEISHTIDQADVYDFFVTYSLSLADAVDMEQLKPQLHAGLTHVFGTPNFTLTSTDDAVPQRLFLVLTRDPSIEKPSLWDYVKSFFDDGPNWRV